MRTDDLSGVEIARALDAVIERKAYAPTGALFLFGILAGIYIGFGAAGAITVTAFDPVPTALSKFLAGTVFCLGLILVVIPGSELFTGNILMTAGIVSRKVPIANVLWNWVVVYVGNFAGGLLLALALYGGGLLGTPAEPTPVGLNAARIATAKIGLPFTAALLRGVLCNMLVCLAVIMAIASRTTFGKILCIYFPIMGFVLSGYEHSIANMCFLPAGLLAQGSLGADFLTMFHNLVPVTIGNVIGGVLVVVLHPARAKKLPGLFRPRRPSE